MNTSIKFATIKSNFLWTIMEANKWYNDLVKEMSDGGYSAGRNFECTVLSNWVDCYKKELGVKELNQNEQFVVDAIFFADCISQGIAQLAVSMVGSQNISQLAPMRPYLMKVSPDVANELRPLIGSLVDKYLSIPGVESDDHTVSYDGVQFEHVDEQGDYAWVLYDLGYELEYLDIKFDHILDIMSTCQKIRSVLLRNVRPGEKIHKFTIFDWFVKNTHTTKHSPLYMWKKAFFDKCTSQCRYYDITEMANMGFLVFAVLHGFGEIDIAQEFITIIRNVYPSPNEMYNARKYFKKIKEEFNKAVGKEMVLSSAKQGFHLDTESFWELSDAITSLDEYDDARINLCNTIEDFCIWVSNHYQGP